MSPHPVRNGGDPPAAGCEGGRSPVCPGEAGQRLRVDPRDEHVTRCVRIPRSDRRPDRQCSCPKYSGDHGGQ